MMEIKEIREKIMSDISAKRVEDIIVADLGLVEKHKKYLCHMHKDTHPSMSFFKDGKMFKCFACGGTYNIIDHYMQYKGYNFYDSLKQINSNFCLNLQFDEQFREHKRPNKSTPPAKHSSTACSSMVKGYLVLTLIRLIYYVAW